MKKVLVIAAHPDDEVLGCGGVMARLAKENYQVHTLILGQGIASRYDKANRKNSKNEIETIKKQAQEANLILGVRETSFFNFPDNSFDSVPLLDIVQAVERLKSKVRPEIVFTNYFADLNIDHQLTYRAVITATRPKQGETVKEIYSFQVLSSTEWNYPTTFAPDVFFDIEDTLEAKLKAMGKYQSEINSFPHPRSIEGIKLHAAYWGMGVGVKYAEVFKSIRVVR